MTLPTARRNLLVTVAMVFSVFTGFAFVLPFLPLFVRDLGVTDPEDAAFWRAAVASARAALDLEPDGTPVAPQFVGCDVELEVPEPMAQRHTAL